MEDTEQKIQWIACPGIGKTTGRDHSENPLGRAKTRRQKTLLLVVPLNGDRYVMVVTEGTSSGKRGTEGEDKEKETKKTPPPVWLEKGNTAERGKLIRLKEGGVEKNATWR